jgi:opacity protein-like surface antigen
MFGNGRIGQSCMESTSRAGSPRSRGGKAAAVASVALAVSLLAAAGAQAQNCAVANTSPIPNLGAVGASPAAVSAVIANTLATASTAFLLQSTAFIGSPSNPAPYQQGGGVWVRGVGGGIDVKSSTNTAVSANTNLPPGGTATAAIACAQQIHQNFAGVQAGADIARLNINGWNTHVGATAGYLETRGHVVGGAFSVLDNATVPGTLVGGGLFDSTTQIPFVGIYAAATRGGFFVDGLIRTEYYQTSLNAPGVNLFNQNIDAHGISFSGSMGYQWQIPNTKWFIEPSAGLIVSRLTVDRFNTVDAGIPPGVPGTGVSPGGDTLSGTLQLQDIKSDIGRAGLRVGTTINSGNLVVQPFVAASVWHEFGPNATATYQSCPGCVVQGGGPITITAASTTTTFGTFGQYSFGFSAAVANTGWLGFARVDYRDGPNLHGVSGTGGIRYQFTPEKARVVTKSRLPVVEAVNWTGFYIGGFGGGVLGTADWNFVGGSANPHVGGYIGGGQIGYNFQSGWWVYGLEADLGKTNLNGGTACAPLAAGPTAAQGVAPMFQMTCNAWANWIATATARVGYAWERALFYVKGGGAWTNEQVSATCNQGPLNAVNIAINFPGGYPLNCSNPAKAFSNGFAASTNIGGWTIGSGIEFALTRNWSAKAEYNYISFGDHNVTASDGSLLNIGMHVSEVKVGVNYRFDGGAVRY